MKPKFRVWNKKTESFIDYGDLMLDLKNGKVYAGDVGIPEYTIDVTKQVVLMQSTGLEDKNGAEVYFNDIVEDEYGHRYEVVFEGDCLRCNGIRRIRGGYKPKNRWFDRDLKIIGNIYENSELKEVAE